MAAVCASGFVEAKDRSIPPDGQVGVGAGPRFESFDDRPRPRLVVTEFDREILAVASQPRRVASIRASQVIGIGEDDAVAIILRLFGQPRDASHADRFYQLFIEDRFRPSGSAVAAEGDRAAIRLRGAPHIEHYTPVSKLRSYCFVRIDEFGRAETDDLTRAPRPAVIVAIDDRSHGRPVPIALCSE